MTHTHTHSINKASCRVCVAQEISAATIDKTPDFGGLLLPDDDARVVAEFDKLQRHALTESDIKESLVHGCSWPKCHAKHHSARNQIAERLGGIEACKQTVTVTV